MNHSKFKQEPDIISDSCLSFIYHISNFYTISLTFQYTLPYGNVKKILFSLLTFPSNYSNTCQTSHSTNQWQECHEICKSTCHWCFKCSMVTNFISNIEQIITLFFFILLRKFTSVNIVFLNIFFGNSHWKMNLNVFC